MALNIQDVLNKAKAKGIVSSHSKNEKNSFMKTWQQESILFNKTDNKPTTELATNWQQTDNRTGNKLATELETNWQQTGNKKDSLPETGNKLATEPTTELETNWQQTGNKPKTFSSLVGLQRAIVIFIYESCKESRNKHTDPLTLEHISSKLNASKGSVKTTIQRLEKKKIIERFSYKNGRGGWSQYFINDLIFKELLYYSVNNKLATNWQQTDNKPATEPTTEPATTSSSSSNIYNKTTTTEELENNDSLLEDWKKINFENLSGIGFGLTQLKQLQDLKIHPEIIQTSIHHFAFGLEHNEKAKSYSNPLNVLMGVLRKGQAWFEPSYRSPQEIALENILKTKTEEMERLKVLEEKCHKLAFSEWSNSLSEEDKKSITSKHKMIPSEVALRLHFTENFWEQKKHEYGLK